MSISTSGMANRQVIAVGIASVGVAAAVMTMWTWNNGRLRRGTKPLHVSYPHPQMPLIIRLLAKLPKSMRKALAIKGSAPKLPIDGIDLLGPEYNPFEIRTLVHDKLWRVRHKYIRDAANIAASKMIFGLDPSDPAILERVPPENVASLQTLMDEMSALEERNGLEPKEQARNELEAGYEDSQDMLVARLDNNGGLLLYNPSRMHSRITAWLEAIGTPVMYIVSGSSSHTNMLPQAATAFPFAKIICAKAAEVKCENVGMQKADYIYTDHHSGSDRGFDAATRELDKYNVQLCHIVGDVLTQTLNVIVHDHLFDVDLSCYGNGNRLLHFDQDEWDQCCDPAIIFHYSTMMNTTISGYLPNFRLMAMDPTSPFCKLCIDEPEGSSCSEMAASLRNMLAMKFSYVDNVHSKRKESLPAKEFIECVDASWNWLDGKSLLFPT